MKPPGDLEAANSGLVIGKHLIISLLLHSKKSNLHKINVINKTYLHPIKKSDYYNWVSPCQENGVLTCLPPSNKNNPYSKLQLLCRIFFQLPVSSYGIYYHPQHSPKNLQTPFNSRLKKCESIIFSKILNPPRPTFSIK